jgi:outer membrane lipoprotein SlyB
MRHIALVPALVAALSLGACATDDYGGRGGYGRPGYSDRDRDRDRDRHDARRDDNRRDARERRQLGKKDRIYRDRDGRYYCQRRDGSRGAIVGALAGGILGNIIAPGDSKTLGTILGAGGGALAGRAIDRKNVRCE